jgi:hypothetical protein
VSNDERAPAVLLISYSYFLLDFGEAAAGFLVGFAIARVAPRTRAGGPALPARR